MRVLKYILLVFLFFLFTSLPVKAIRETDSYDGNIFPIYAGNGSIVPAQTTLKEAFEKHRVSILFFYLDDSAASKALAPVISGLDLIWKDSLDIIALTTDEIQGKVTSDKREPAHYWNGRIPQTLVLDGEGNVQFDKNGTINIDEINKVISSIKKLDYDDTSFGVESFNEYNSRISIKRNNAIKDENN